MADSLALVMLEVMVHVPSYHVLNDRVAIPVRFDEEVIEVLDDDELPVNWASMPPSRETQALGDEWVMSKRTPVLQVPGVIVGHAFNYLLNPGHPDFV